MLDFLAPGRAALCGGASRREFLQVGALSAIGLSLPQAARAAAEGRQRPGHAEIGQEGRGPHAGGGSRRG